MNNSVQLYVASLVLIGGIVFAVVGPLGRIFTSIIQQNFQTIRGVSRVMYKICFGIGQLTILVVFIFLLNFSRLDLIGIGW